jgi:hypothetical protein
MRNDNVADAEHALSLMQTALALLDGLETEFDAAAHLDLAIHSVTKALAKDADPQMLRQAF